MRRRVLAIWNAVLIVWAAGVAGLAAYWRQWDIAAGAAAVLVASTVVLACCATATRRTAANARRHDNPGEG